MKKQKSASSEVATPNTVPSPQGRYGWHVEVEGHRNTVFVGDYISVTGEGELLIWGFDEKIRHRFEPEEWLAAFACLEIKQFFDEGAHIVSQLTADGAA